MLNNYYLDVAVGCQDNSRVAK